MAAEKSSTHKKILKKAIEDETIQIVGITGLGGVGKTTLASEVAVKMKNQFAQIVFATITATVDTKTIRKKIEVATRRRLSKGEKILIILDDMREELKLDELLGREEMMNCKILITSRSKDVCEAMNAQEVITVNPLEEEEACALFEQAVGKNVWQEDSLKELALEIVKECCGLPLLIQAVGSALKNKGITSWETMRNRLQDPTEEHQRKGMNQLKLSYDYLESEVAKSCFLLCSMFPEDSLISLATLTYYGLALGIFDNPDDHISIQDARRKVQVAIDSLKSSFLLLPRGKFDDGKKEETFKMHDLVRDMAILITSGGNCKFWVESGKSLSEWEPETHLESCKKISLMRNYISKLPDHELVFPHLDTFLIQDNQMLSIPDEFFQGMQKLKVLDMSGNKFSSLTQSLTQLTELHTLDLSANVPIVDISILGELTCLEILKLRATRITHIPEEIGQLSNLRLLDLYLCSRLVYVTPGVISKLTRLEELYVQMSMEEKWNFLVELSKLESLKVLHLAIHKSEYIPEDFHTKTSLEFYVTDDYTFHLGHHYQRIVHISETTPSFGISTMKLLQGSEMLSMRFINNLNNILPELFPASFEGLKHLRLQSCKNVTSLVKTCDLEKAAKSNKLDLVKTKGKFFSQVEEIDLSYMKSLAFLWDSPHHYISFCNMRKISIKSCHSLLELFPLSVA